MQKTYPDYQSSARVNPARAPSLDTLFRVTKFTLVKAAVLFVAVAIGLYLTILVVNLGGYVDDITRGQINETLESKIVGGEFAGMTYEQLTDTIFMTRWVMEEEAGLHEPFLNRSIRWFGRAFVLDWGSGYVDWAASQDLGTYFPIGNKASLREMLLTRFPYTLVLVGASNLLLFFTSVPLALLFSRRRGKFWDGLSVFLSSVTSAPSWIHGVILIFIFVTLLGVMPYPRGIGYDEIKSFNYQTIPLILREMVLPVAAIFMSLFFQSLYNWRTFFLIYSDEDYVETGRAIGLSDRALERKYILRPTLPYIITSFAMLAINMFQGLIALEILFGWPGVGLVFVYAIWNINTPLMLGVVTLFAYMLTITVLLLEVLCALVDPRIKIGTSAAMTRPSRKQKVRSIGSFKKRTAPLYRAVIFQRPVSRPRSCILPRLSLAGRLRRLWSKPGTLRLLLRQPSGLIGSIILAVLIGASLYTLIAVPSEQVADTWLHPDLTAPRNALPKWVNVFRNDKLPETVLFDSRNASSSEIDEVALSGMRIKTISFDFNYAYASFPQDVTINLFSSFSERRSLAQLVWWTPDGRKIDLGTQTPGSSASIYLSENESIRQEYDNEDVVQVLFADPASSVTAPLEGSYRLEITSYIFEEGAEFDAQLILYGRVFGLAGTDHLRRDLALPLMWGLPIALSFGIIGAIAVTLLSMIVAAIGAWFGGWVDNLVQRLVEVNMILPTLAIAVLVYVLYSHSIWVILGIVVALNIFGSSLKNYRAAFLQVKQAPYIESALAQGAGNWRIIWRYIVPRIMPIMLPQLVTMVPVYVYYEVTLAYLGIRDYITPTWGQMIFDALKLQSFTHYPHLLLLPLGLLLFTGLGFALLGLGLDRVMNPRLRE